MLPKPWSGKTFEFFRSKSAVPHTPSLHPAVSTLPASLKYILHASGPTNHPLSLVPYLCAIAHTRPSSRHRVQLSLGGWRALYASAQTVRAFHYSVDPWLDRN
jgi:hypothetical protein